MNLRQINLSWWMAARPLLDLLQVLHFTKVNAFQAAALLWQFHSPLLLDRKLDGLGLLRFKMQVWKKRADLTEEASTWQRYSEGFLLSCYYMDQKTAGWWQENQLEGVLPWGASGGCSLSRFTVCCSKGNVCAADSQGLNAVQVCLFQVSVWILWLLFF